MLTHLMSDEERERRREEQRERGKGKGKVKESRRKGELCPLCVCFLERWSG